MNYEEIQAARNKIFNYEKLQKVDFGIDDFLKIVREEIDQCKNEKIGIELLKLHKKLSGAYDHLVNIQVEINKATLKNKR